jgi:hypothetical protein
MIATQMMIVAMEAGKMKKMLILAGFIIFCLVLFFIYTSKRCNYERLIEKSIPYSAKVLESYDTHGGFHGDGESYIVYQFNNEQFKKFFTNITKDNDWKKLPLSDDIKKVSHWFSDGEKQRKYEIPIEISNGLYFIRDFQHSKKPIWDRYSVNFVIAIVDSSQKRLYICQVDS